MKLTKFSIQTVVSQARRAYKAYIILLAPLMVIMLAPGALETLVNSYLLPMIPGAQQNVEWVGLTLVGQRAILGSIVSLIVALVATWLQIGYVNNELEVLTMQKPTTTILFWGTLKQLLSFIGWGIVSGAIIVVGFIALIVPGIYFLVKLSLFKYYIAQWYGGIASIKASWKATKGNFRRIIGTRFVCLGIVILWVLVGAILIAWGWGEQWSILTIIGGVISWLGLFAAVILVSLINANIYRTLQVNTPKDITPTRLE